MIPRDCGVGNKRDFMFASPLLSSPLLPVSSCRRYTIKGAHSFGDLRSLLAGGRDATLGPDNRSSRGALGGHLHIRPQVQVRAPAHPNWGRGRHFLEVEGRNPVGAQLNGPQPTPATEP